MPMHSHASDMLRVSETVEVCDVAHTQALVLPFCCLPNPHFKNEFGSIRSAQGYATHQPPSTEVTVLLMSCFAVLLFYCFADVLIC